MYCVVLFFPLFLSPLYPQKLNDSEKLGIYDNYLASFFLVVVHHYIFLQSQMEFFSSLMVCHYFHIQFQVLNK